MSVKKVFIIAGIIIFIISLCVVLPLEYAKASYISEFVYTYLTLAIGLLITMYGLLGKHFFKGLIFLFCSVIISICAWLVFYPTGFLSKLLSLWLGAPSGIVAGLIFLIVNYQFLVDENRYKLFFKQLMVYAIILFVVSILFAKGSNWMEDISVYLKSSSEQP